jgi:hypothetical protein
MNPKTYKTSKQFVLEAFLDAKRKATNKNFDIMDK